MDFDLKSFREDKLKMTQAQLAELIGVRQDTISRMEKDPASISIDIAMKIATQTGLTLDQLLNFHKEVIAPLAVQDKFEKAAYVKHTLAEYINRHLKALMADDEVRSNRVVEIQRLINKSIKKPRIAFIGRSDSGKSTMINALLGKDSMPTDWSPTTSIIVYIKHVDDRPAFIENDLWIFRKGSDDSIGWDDNRLNDEVYCRNMKIASGDIGMLATYGTRTGDKFDVNEIGSAVAFVDSPILKNVDLVDIPGFAGGRQSDHELAEQGRTLADVLIYLSQANGFMSEEDTLFLKNGIQSVGCPEKRGRNILAPLSNIYVVATQAHTVNSGNPEALTKIINSGCERFYSTITEHFWDDRKECSGYNYSEMDLRKRFFTYSTDIAHTRTAFETDLKQLVEKLPDCILSSAILNIKQFCEDQKLQISKEIGNYRNLIEKRDSVVQQLHEIDANEPRRKQIASAQRAQIIALINDCKAETRKLFNQSYINVLSTDHIVDVIKAKGFKSKKEDMKRLASRINSELEDEMKLIIKKQSKKVSDAVNDFIKDFESGCNFAGAKMEAININTFNAERAFVSGLAGLTTLGALGLWASTLGNLGGYILVAKGVGILSTLGISVGGGAAATAAIASIGGPLTLGIGLAVIIGLGVFGLLTGSWRTKAAKNLKKAFDDANAPEKCCENLDKYWNDTIAAFNKAANEMENEWTEFVFNLRNTLDNYDIDALQNAVRKSRELNDFFDGILRHRVL